MPSRPVFSWIRCTTPKRCRQTRGRPALARHADDQKTVGAGAAPTGRSTAYTIELVSPGRTPWPTELAPNVTAVPPIAHARGRTSALAWLSLR